MAVKLESGNEKFSNEYCSTDIRKLGKNKTFHDTGNLIVNCEKGRKKCVKSTIFASGASSFDSRSFFSVLFAFGFHSLSLLHIGNWFA